VAGNLKEEDIWMQKTTSKVTIIGIGNVLMGDEGVGVHIARYLTENKILPPDVECIDGGTGSMTLLEPMQTASTLILIDATVDADPPGTVKRLRPKFSSDYPKTLTAHDIGLKDLLDTFYLLGKEPNVILYAVSIHPLGEIELEMSAEAEAVVVSTAEAIVREVVALQK
jgi:hydrogenase maturation protease